MTDARSRHAEAFRTHAIREGEFELSSGGTTNWYLDGRQVTFRGDCQPLVGQAVLELLDTEGVAEFDAVGGMTLGADRWRSRWQQPRA